MPLKSGKSKKIIQANIKELVADNKKTGKEKGVNGKEKPIKQIVAISYSKAKEKSVDQYGQPIQKISPKKK